MERIAVQIKKIRPVNENMIGEDLEQKVGGENQSFHSTEDPLYSKCEHMAKNFLRYVAEVALAAPALAGYAWGLRYSLDENIGGAIESTLKINAGYMLTGGFLIGSMGGNAKSAIAGTGIGFIVAAIPAAIGGGLGVLTGLGFKCFTGE